MKTKSMIYWGLLCVAVMLCFIFAVIVSYIAGEHDSDSFIILDEYDVNLYLIQPTIILGAEETQAVPAPFPVDLSFSHFGSNVTWLCNCSGELLNRSSFMWLHSLESYGGSNWSYRPPVNLMSDDEGDEGD